MTDESNVVHTEDDLRKTRFDFLIEMGNTLTKILAIDRSHPAVDRAIEMAITKRDEMLMWAQTGFHMHDKQLLEAEAEKAKEAEDARSTGDEQPIVEANTEASVSEVQAAD